MLYTAVWHVGEFLLYAFFFPVKAELMVCLREIFSNIAHILAQAAG